MTDGMTARQRADAVAALKVVTGGPGR
jgi:hypothetical protein